MRPCLVRSLLVLSVAFASSALAVEHEAPHKIKVVVTPPDPTLTIYYVGLLTKGPRAGEGTHEERHRDQANSMAYMNRLAHEGKLLVAGPIDDPSDWRGIYLYKCSSLAEAQALAAADPAVKAGRLSIEVHAWLTEKGAIRDPEFRPSK